MPSGRETGPGNRIVSESRKNSLKKNLMLARKLSILWQNAGMVGRVNQKYHFGPKNTVQKIGQILQNVSSEFC